MRALYEGGFYVQAYEASRSLGPLDSWQESSAQLLGSRLAGNIGAPRLSRKLLSRAYRTDRSHPAAIYFRAAHLYSYRGPYRSLRFLQSQSDFSDASPSDQADLFALRARLLSSFRDFNQARHFMEKALQLASDRAWIWCEQAEFHRANDDQAAALSAVEEALRLTPLYRPAVQAAAEILQALSRDDDALALLSRGDAERECGYISAQLAMLQTELGDDHGALRSWERAVTLYPLAEPIFEDWLQRNLADAFYHVSNFERAREFAKKVDDPFYQSFAERLSQRPKRSRVVLPVQFVAQHHLTCAPATLSALSLYWKHPVDHAELAAEICYEGTYDHIERHWAEREGFVVREFCLTWESACSLIDAGVPFALVTTETTSAHLQALIGYDSLRRTFILRDPSHRIHNEVDAEAFLRRYEAFGPRAMAMLPKSEAHRMAHLELPDSEVYDGFYRFQRALEHHDRPAAASEFEQMVACHDGHRLTRTARRRLAGYDADVSQELAAVEDLLQLFPKNGNLLWSKACLLGRLFPGQEPHRDFLREMATGPEGEPVFWRDWGYELSKDGRRQREGRRFVLLALRSQPVDADNIGALASSLWDERHFAKAVELYRIAACLPGGGERFGRSYFIASRHVRKTEEALQFLRERFERAGRVSVQPTRALFNALSTLDRMEEALALLEEALKLRPDDGELLLFAADELARSGFAARANEILESARSHTSRSSWLRVAAGIEGYRCDHLEALKLWHQILEVEPLAIDALRAVARLMAETQGRAAALAFLEHELSRFPHYTPLFEIHVEWLRDEAPETAELAIRSALALHPDNAWLLRELALNLAQQRCYEEALKTAREALNLEPFNSVSHRIIGHVQRLSGHRDEAFASLREALQVSVDDTFAMRDLFACCRSFEEKKEAVAFLREELIRQVVFGDGIYVFREEAYSVLGPDALLAVLQEAHVARPDLWQTGIVVVQQLVDMRRLDEALAKAQEMTKTFPLLPRCWFELSTVRKAREEWDEEIFALEQALALNPVWTLARRTQAEAYERRQDLKRSREILDQAVTWAPLEAANHGVLADVLWRLGEREPAVERLKQAIRLSPGYDWAWQTLTNWSVELGRENLGFELARELTVSRAGEVRSWLALASALDDSALSEKLEALDKAEALEPMDSDIHDYRAFVLARAGKFEEALSACHPEVLGDSVPAHLRGREAWIQAERGDLVTAVEIMKEVVSGTPDYYWGWNRMADWLTNLGEFSEAQKAAENMARLAPRAAVPLGYIGDLQLRQGEKKAAWETFRRAFHLDASYDYAARQLFDGYLEAGEIKNAEEVLQALQIHHAGPLTDASRVRLLAKQRKKADALVGLKALCFAPERVTLPLQVADLAVTAAGWGDAVKKLYQTQLNEPGINPRVAALWVKHFTERSFRFSHWRLSRLAVDSPIGLAARHAYLDHATAKGHRRLVKGLIRRDGAALRSDSACWGQVSYALSTLDLHKDVVEWMKGWRDRSDLRPWMLWNLSISFRSLGRFPEAHEVNLHAVTLRGDQTTFLSHLSLAWDSAIAGDYDAARQRLSIVPGNDEDTLSQVVRALTNALISMGAAAPEEREAEYERSKMILRQEGWAAQFATPFARKMGQRTVEELSQLSGKMRFRLAPLFDLPFGDVPPAIWLLFAFLFSGFIKGCVDFLDGR